MRFVFAGKGIRSIACLKYLLKHKYRPVLVIGQPQDDSGLVQLAKARQIPTYIPQNINSQTAIKTLKSFKPDLLVLAGFSQILKSPVINVSKKGTINLHGGPLPHYRGASVLNWQIINGETTGGISIIFVDKGIDTGDIIASQTFSIPPFHTIKDVVNTTLKLFPPLLFKTLKKIEADTVKRIPQDKSAGRYWSKRRPQDGWFKPHQLTSQQAYNFVRALTQPYPGAMVKKNNQSYVLWQVKPVAQKPSADKLFFKTKDGFILATDYSPLNIL